MAFQIIDNENIDTISNDSKRESIVIPMVPIYENIDETPTKAHEPHYQVPRKNSVPIPLYENVELMFPSSSNNSRFSMAESNGSFGVDDGTEMVFPIDQSKYLIKEPPKEKPPPLPVLETLEDQGDQLNNFKRINSTKRIKKEIRSKRSSFLGIEGEAFDEFALNLLVAPPPDIQALLKEEKRLEKQLYPNVSLYQNPDHGRIHQTM